jgi:hypothetical protein
MRARALAALIVTERARRGVPGSRDGGGLRVPRVMRRRRVQRASGRRGDEDTYRQH